MSVRTGVDDTSPVRECKFAPVDLKSVTADGTFTGYASLFGEPDLAGDVVMPGAFAASLAERGAGIKMLFQHDPAEPIGVWLDIREDDTGLFVRGRLMEEVARAREILSLMRAGVLDGLSIGFRTVTAHTDPETGHRVLDHVDLWEISVVTFPMLPNARVGHARTGDARIGDARIGQVKTVGPDRRPTEREFERWLRRDAGLTRREARLVIARGFRALPPREAVGASEARLARAIARAARVMTKPPRRVRP